MSAPQLLLMIENQPTANDKLALSYFEAYFQKHGIDGFENPGLIAPGFAYTHHTSSRKTRSVYPGSRKDHG